MASMAGYRSALGRAAGGAAILATSVACLAPSLGQAADDPRDAAFLSPMLQQALETARTSVEVPWRNPATGNHGTIVVERTFYREPETPCRAYVRTLEGPGAAPQVTKGTGCRSSTGLWVVEEEPATLAGPAPSATTGPPPRRQARPSRRSWPKPVRPAPTPCSCPCRRPDHPCSPTPCRPGRSFEARAWTPS